MSDDVCCSVGSDASDPASAGFITAGFSLRLLGPADEVKVCEMENEIFHEDPWTPPMVREELSARHRCYIAAIDEGGDWLGYAGISLGVDADIMTLGVRGAARRRGVGSAMLEFLIVEARRAGSERVFLEVRASNDGAIRLYEGGGFEKIGRIRRYFRHPTEDALTMCRLMEEPSSFPNDTAK